MHERKEREWRPDPCEVRLGDIVVINERKFLKVKCRRCTKSSGSDTFHYIELAPSAGV
jgi:hypothetical protein